MQARQSTMPSERVYTAICGIEGGKGAMSPLTAGHAQYPV